MFKVIICKFVSGEQGVSCHITDTKIGFREYIRDVSYHLKKQRRNMSNSIDECNSIIQNSPHHKTGKLLVVTFCWECFIPYPNKKDFGLILGRITFQKGTNDLTFCGSLKKTVGKGGNVD